MKVLFLNLTAVLFGLVLCAQNPNYNIIVHESTNNDTALMDLLGVISGPLPPPNSPLPDISPQLLDIGVTSIRNNDNYDDKLDMEALFRCPGSPVVPAWYCSPDDSINFHYKASDSLFSVIQNNGFNLFFRLGGESQSGLSSQHHVFQGPQDTVAENNWIKASVKVVEHYDNFNGGSGYLPYLDIWTEWPNGVFWERDDDEFIWFFTKALDTLKTHFPDKKIGGPGFLVPTVLVINGQVNTKAYDLLYSLFTHQVKPDFISWHLWQLDPMMYYIAGEQFRDLLNGNGDFSSVPWSGSGFFEDVEILCGAYGVPKLNGNTGEEFSDEMKYLLYNTQKGASLLTADWISMQYGNTVKAFYYRDADPVSDPDTTLGLIGSSGLFYGNNEVTYKPNAYAFKLWSRLFNEFHHKLECDFPVLAADSSRLWVLPANNSYGGYGILVSNTDSIAKTFTISIPGIIIDTTLYDIYYNIVNDNYNGNIEFHHFNTTFNIDVQTVELIRIIPKEYPLISNNKVKNNITVFPNPASDDLIIQSKKRINRVQLINMNGEMVTELYPVNNNIHINIRNLCSGVYSIKLYVQDEYITKKLVINHH